MCGYKRTLLTPVTAKLPHQTLLSSLGSLPQSSWQVTFEIAVLILGEAELHVKGVCILAGQKTVHNYVLPVSKEANTLKQH